MSNTHTVSIVGTLEYCHESDVLTLRTPDGARVSVFDPTFKADVLLRMPNRKSLLLRATIPPAVCDLCGKPA